MTPYTAYNLTPDLPDDGGVYRLEEAADLQGLNALGHDEASLLDALFDADGATPDALGARTDTPRAAIDAALGALARRGLVETTESGAWLTGEAFGLRRAVRRAGERRALHTRQS